MALVLAPTFESNKSDSTHIGGIVVSAGGLAGVGSAALGVDVEAVRAGGEAADGAADAQRRQERALLQPQVAAHSAP